ncbi:MFS transporter [Candidatus Tokpelaia sp.]|uniref:MFS transporter n=1 Tax=Candidatus Tokpelaia sp. TaxID=2233777 RepID=UPI001238E763|nr:MFS transporter [Candidatus Tokpelaia sp.]KAA6405558.1 hypothetical protein DPQ22_04465 [Candidatus Tokpelaia sp.]
MTAATHTGWRALLQGRQGLYCLTLTAGILLYALVLPVSYTILPAIAKELNAGLYYAWIAMLFALGSLVGACLLNHILHIMPAPMAYAGALFLFAGGSLACAYAPVLAFLLAACGIMGLGGGLMVALTYTMLNTALPPGLLPRSIGLISAMWGLATLIGPYLGGWFENWRLPFFIIGSLSLLFCPLAAFMLNILGRTQQKRQGRRPEAAPLLPVFILTSLVFVISAGSLLENLQAERDSLFGACPFFRFIIGLLAGNTGSLGLAFLLIVFLAVTERNSAKRLLPAGTFSLSSVFAPLYGIIILNMVALGGARLYLPLFLQNLHQAGPVSAGYLSFVDTIGWTIGTLIGATFNTAKPDKGSNKNFFQQKNQAGSLFVFIIAPLGCIFGLGGAFLLVPVLSGSYLVLGLIGCSLFITGFFSGILWPHILARIVQNAAEGEQEAAGSSLVTIQFFAAAMADCLAGAVANITGLQIENTASLAHSAAVLFGYCLLLLLIVFFLCLRVKTCPD